MKDFVVLRTRKLSAVMGNSRKGEVGLGRAEFSV